MSKSITASITLAAKAVPAGVIAGNFRIWLLTEGGSIVAQQDTAETSVSFQAIEAGTYSVMAVRLDIAGGAISDSVSSAMFTIEPESAPATVSIDVPASVVVTLA